jgi:hypothetical protein
VSIPPHPSSITPQCAPAASHVLGLQPQRLAAPAPPHVSGAVHVPQLSVFPQPSETVPQFKLSVRHVFGTQIPVPHLFAPPTPHMSVPVHVPHIRI